MQGYERAHRIGYSALAAGIVRQACEDYRKALRQAWACRFQRTAGESSRKMMADNRISECERFFDSDWFTELVDIDGPTLADKLREMVAREVG